MFSRPTSEANSSRRQGHGTANETSKEFKVIVVSAGSEVPTNCWSCCCSCTRSPPNGVMYDTTGRMTRGCEEREILAKYAATSLSCSGGMSKVPSLTLYAAAISSVCAISSSATPCAVSTFEFGLLLLLELFGRVHQVSLMWFPLCGFPYAVSLMRGKRHGEESKKMNLRNA